MTKSKTTSPFNSKIKILSIITLLLSSIYTIIVIQKTPPSFYSTNEDQRKNITGTIINCQKTDHYQILLKAKENLIVNYYKPFKCTEGQKIKVTGKLQKPNSFRNFNLFNYQKYLYSKKINYIINADKIKIINKKISLPYIIKNKLTKHINSYKSKDYLNTFIIGNTKDLNKDVITSYQNNGISHLFAISGMHITILTLIILYLLNKISKNTKLNYLITYLFLLFYIFITAFTPSIIRASCMFIILTLTKKIKAIYLLILLCAVNLFINPYIIYNLGFTLSYITTFYLLICSKTINNTQKYLNKIFSISVIAFLASTPILIQNFFQINLLSPLINLIFVPLISIIIFPFALLTLIIKPLDNILFTLTNIMEKLSLIINNISFFTITLKHVSIPIFILYYILITYIIYKLIKKQNKSIILLLITLIIHTNINYFDASKKITIIDVGQGDSILIKLENNKGNILIDTGGLVNFAGKSYNLAQNITIKYLKSEGIKKIDYLILTHGDYDHMGEAINLVNNFKVKKVIFNCGSNNDLENHLIKALNKKKIKYYSCIKELNVINHKLYFLNTKEYDNENTNSSIIYTKMNNYKFLFMGDASIKAEKEILKKYNLPNIDILKVAHHGSKTSSSTNFIKKINPKYSVISVGKNNMYGHPNKKVLNNLENSKIYRTDTDGSIMFKIKNNKLNIKTCKT